MMLGFGKHALTAAALAVTIGASLAGAAQAGVTANDCRDAVQAGEAAADLMAQATAIIDKAKSDVAGGALPKSWELFSEIATDFHHAAAKGLSSFCRNIDVRHARARPARACGSASQRPWALAHKSNELELAPNFNNRATGTNITKKEICDAHTRHAAALEREGDARRFVKAAKAALPPDVYASLWADVHA